MKELIISIAMAACTLPGMAQEFEYYGCVYSVIDQEALTCKFIRPTQPTDYLVIDSKLTLDDSVFTVIGIGYDIDYTSSIYPFSPMWHRVLRRLTIPDTVRSIDSYAFSRCTALSSVEFADGLTSIGNGAFYNCSALLSVELPQSLISVGDGAFYGCSSLQSVELPQSLTTIEKDTFYGCSSLRSVELPQSLTSIGDRTFYGCSSLRSVELPQGLTSIGEWAFSDCPLKTLTVPAGVTDLGEGFLSRCEYLERVEVDPANKCYTVVDGVLFDSRLNILLAYPAMREGKAYTVPTTVTAIGGGAFSTNTHIEDLTLPEGLERIGTNAFYGCTRLTRLDFPSTLVELSPSAFANSSLREVVIHEGVRTLEYTCENCADLETVWISGEFDNVEWPFHGCDNIRRVYYLAETIQPDNGRWEEHGHLDHYYSYQPGTIDWDLVKQQYHESDIKWHPATLYVLESNYRKVKNKKLFPWSYFEHIEVYDPEKDPAPNAVDQVSSDSDTTGPVSVYTMSGTKIADSTDNLPAGLYIVRRGPKTEKIVIR